MNLDSDALRFAASVLPEYLAREQEFAVAVCRFETNFGQGWVALAAKLGLSNPERFREVENWGAVTSTRQGPKPLTAELALEPDRFFMRDRWWRNYGPGKP